MSIQKLFFYSIFFSCLGFTIEKKDDSLQSENILVAESSDIKVYDFKSLEPLLYTKKDKIHIVNFWAMWCAPCITELPYLQAYAEKNPEVEVLLISLDFPEHIETRLKPFLKKKGIDMKVIVLDEPDANSWINKIDSNWSGAIPFTIIFDYENRSFREKAFESVQDLEGEINRTINN